MRRLVLVIVPATCVLTLAFQHRPGGAAPAAESQPAEAVLDEASGAALADSAGPDTAREAPSPPEPADQVGGPDEADEEVLAPIDLMPAVFGRSRYAAERAGRPRRGSSLGSPVWPARGVITTYFGEVGPHSPRGHAGIDISAPWGSPVRAASAGRVTAAGWSDGYGYRVVIEHRGDHSTLSAHLARVEVEEGQPVARGQQIGLLGSTGYSTGPHLHFEVRHRGVLRDPLTYLP